MPESTFFRLLKTPIDQKGSALAALIADLNAGNSPLPRGEGPGVRAFTLDPTDFSLIPGSPFAYWAGDAIRQFFPKLPKLGDLADAKQGLATADDFRFVRAWWEVPTVSVAYNAEETEHGKAWAHFAKGGEYSPFYADVHLVSDWENHGERIKTRTNPGTGKPFSNVWQLKGTEAVFFFRPGLTWPRRTAGFSVRALPAGCIFADKGPAAFVPDDCPTALLALLALMNSLPFGMLVRVQLARTELAQSFEVGLIQRTPVPPLEGAARERLAALAREAHDLQRDRDRADETTHAFCLPSLARYRQGSLLQASRALEAEEQARQRRLAEIQAEIDDIVFDLYGMGEADRALVRAEMGTSRRDTESTEKQEETPQNLGDLRASVANRRHGGTENTEQSEQDSDNLRVLRASVANRRHGGTENTEQSEQDSDNLRVLRASVANRSHGDAEQFNQESAELGVLRAPVADDEEEAAPLEDLPTRVQNLLMWCVGVAFGRWDVRMALDPSRLPPLGGPFDPLPRCAPGALVGPDGLPVTKRSVGYGDTDEANRPEGSTGDARHFGASPADPYPLPIPWDGILVDDPTHPSDIVARVRKVLDLVWGDRSDPIEQEACRVLGVRDLREWFRDPRKGFFAFHIKRYSKSRRKAPIYWLLQSEKRHYAIWIYCHRMRQDILYAAGRSYADYKIVLERNHLEDLRADLESLSGSARRSREREIERQQKVIDDIVAFGKRLDAAALLDIPPDLNDGILISMAPLRELVPWSEVARMWESLRAGQYPWSTMSQQMRRKGLVKG